MKVHLDVLLADHELHIDSLNRREGPSVQQLLCREADSHLQLKTLELDISVTFGLHEALLEFEVTAMEGSREVIGLENDGVIGHIIVEID